MSKQPPRSASNERHDTSKAMVVVLLGAAALAMLARLVLAWLSEGSNDAPSFRGFAQQIDQHGLLWMYPNNFLFNHPPAVGYWTWAAWKLTRGSQPDLFAPIFKLPMIAADLGSAWLLWRIGVLRRGPLLGALMAAAFSWSLVAILVGAYHCNTDNLYAFFCLLAVYLLDKAHRPDAALAASRDERDVAKPVYGFLAGLALGAAINVKLIPILLIVPLLLSCRGTPIRSRFIWGLAAMAIPYIPLMVWTPVGFFRNSLAYRSQVDRWGIPFLSSELRAEPVLKVLLEPVNSLYTATAAGTILLLVVLLAVFNGLRPRWNRAQLCALCLAVFLILTPGFGVQYTVILVPLLFAADLRFAALYSALGGMFLLVTYYVFWTGEFPMYSYFDAPLPLGGALIGLITWVLLAQWAFRLAVRHPPPAPVEPPAPVKP